MGELTSFVRVGGPRGEMVEIGRGWALEKGGIGGREGRFKGGSWFICEGMEEGT